MKTQKQSVTNLISDAISQMDLFSMPPTIKVLKQDKFHTKIGLMLTFTIIALITFYLYSVLDDLFNHPSAQIVQAEYALNTPPVNIVKYYQPVTLQKANFTLVVVLRDLNLTAIGAMGTVFNIVVSNCFKYTNQVEQVCTNYPMQQCSMENHFISDYQKAYFALLNLTNTFCIDSDAWDAKPPVLEGTTAATNVSYLAVIVNQCVNDTLTQNCAPQSIIDKTLSSYYYTIYMSDSLLNMNSPNEPFNPTIGLSYVAITNKNSLYLSDPRRLTSCITDQGIVLQNLVHNQTLFKTQIQQTISQYNNKYLVFHGITIDQKETVYNRSYQKLQQALGNVGGLFQLIFFVTQVLISPIIRLMMNIELANKIFSFFQVSLPEVKKSHDGIFKVHQIGKIKTKIQIQSFLKAKQRSLSLNCKELIFLLCGCRKQAKKQIYYATEKIQNKLDVEFFLTKLFELEKLKQILLNKDQLQVFNYLQKPNITADLFIPGNEQLLQKLENNPQYNFLIQEEKSDYEKLIKAFYSYYRISRSQDNIDRALVDNLDSEIVELFTRISGGHTRLDLDVSNLVSYLPEDNIEVSEHQSQYLSQDRNSRVALQKMNINGDVDSIVQF